MIIGVDADGTIWGNDYPNTGKMKFLSRFFLRKLYKKHTLILWTCREREFLYIAKERLKKENIQFDFYNENTPWRISQYGGDCRKLSCDFLVDDMAGFVWWPWVYFKIKCREWFSE